MNRNDKFDSSNKIWMDKFGFIENYQILSYDTTINYFLVFLNNKEFKTIKWTSNTTLVVDITQQSVSSWNPAQLFKGPMRGEWNRFSQPSVCTTSTIMWSYNKIHFHQNNHKNTPYLTHFGAIWFENCEIKVWAMTYTCYMYVVCHSMLY